MINGLFAPRIFAHIAYPPLPSSACVKEYRKGYIGMGGERTFYPSSAGSRKLEYPLSPFLIPPSTISPRSFRVKLLDFYYGVRTVYATHESHFSKTIQVGALEPPTFINGEHTRTIVWTAPFHLTVDYREIRSNLPTETWGGGCCTPPHTP